MLNFLILSMESSGLGFREGKTKSKGEKKTNQNIHGKSNQLEKIKQPLCESI